MARVECFEDLAAWQKARNLTKSVYAITSKDKFSRDRGLSSQIQRATVSIMSNIAEGFERFRLNEFHQFLSIAKGSCAEVSSQLYVAKDLGYIDQATFETLMRETKDLSRLIGALRASIMAEIRKLKEDQFEYSSASQLFSANNVDDQLQDAGLRTQDQ